MSGAQRILELDLKHVWRPYTGSEERETRSPLVVTGARGSHLFVERTSSHDHGEEQPRSLLDGTGSWWCKNLGHQHPRLLNALQSQAEVLAHCSYSDAAHEAAVLLASELVEVAPAGLSRVFYSDNGSSAVEVALKMALQYWQQSGRGERQKFVALPGAYHGDTIGAMSVGAQDEFTSCFHPILFDSLVPRPKQTWTQTFAELTRIIRERSNEIAGVIVEPILQGVNAMQVYDPALLKELAEVAREVDTLLICDEVFTGFGRTGPMWGVEHAGVTPDILCTAKGLSGGMLPFAATLATERVFDGFRGDKRRALMHGHTFYGNPLGAAIAREVLAIYREDEVLAKAVPKAAKIRAAFAEFKNLPGVSAVRSIGMMGAVDVGEAGYFQTAGRQVCERALDLGALLRPLGNTIYITPPINIADADLDSLLSILGDALEQTLRA